MSREYPTFDECRDRLRRAGWPLGETCLGALWQVAGANGENRLLAAGATQSQAWWRACVLAREVGMPAAGGGAVN
jgi:hypothetical protein